ncbi:MAG: hypothetical protein JWO73_816 [Candidatus Taylorbacteria bacterium]|nr:hypothetical protein [Candidatus Taylorbacteria bacterium]
MPITRFNNQKFSVIYGTKDDKDINGLAEDSGITSLLGLDPADPHRHVITLDLQKIPHSRTRVNGHGIILGKHAGFIPSLGMMTADCPGLAVINAADGTIGLLHLSWLQLYARTSKKFFRTWAATYPYDPADLKIFVGPSICSKCFTLQGWKGWLRFGLFSLSSSRKFLMRSKAGVRSIDLRGMLRDQLMQAGFADSQIDFYPDCTFETASLSSHRREGKAKTTSNVIILKVS